MHEARTSPSDIRQMRERVPHVLSGTRTPRHPRPHSRPIPQARSISPRTPLTLPLPAALNKIRLFCRLTLQPSLCEAKQAPSARERARARESLTVPYCAQFLLESQWLCRVVRKRGSLVHGEQQKARRRKYTR
jgi:hypothetical protein